METKEINKIKEEIIHDDLLMAMSYLKIARAIVVRVQDSEELSIHVRELEKIQDDLNEVAGDINEILAIVLYARMDDICKQPA